MDKIRNEKIKGRFGSRECDRQTRNSEAKMVWTPNKDEHKQTNETNMGMQDTEQKNQRKAETNVE